jgi:hypothetical protein
MVKQAKLWMLAAILSVCGVMSAQALVMTHAYSNAIIDKVEEALKSGLVGNEDDDW